MEIPKFASGLALCAVLAAPASAAADAIALPKGASATVNADGVWQVTNVAVPTFLPFDQSTCLTITESVFGFQWGYGYRHLDSGQDSYLFSPAVKVMLACRNGVANIVDMR